jgi:AraC-like DNA-binding protein
MLYNAHPFVIALFSVIKTHRTSLSCVEELASVLSISEPMLWKKCRSLLGFSPHEIIDYLKADHMLVILERDAETKVYSLECQLKFRSDSSFQEFTKRVFNCCPTEVKHNLAQARATLNEKFSGLANDLHEFAQSSKKPMNETKEKIRVKKQGKETKKKKRGRN